MLSVTGAGLLSENNCFQLSRYHGDPFNLQVMVGALTWFSKRSGILKAGESTTKTAYQKKDLSAKSLRTSQVIDLNSLYMHLIYKEFLSDIKSGEEDNKF